MASDMVVVGAMAEVWAIVVAAGSGSRFGGAKQYELLDGVRIVDRSVANAADACDGVVLVVSAADVDREHSRHPSLAAVVAGGATRSQSVAAGLQAVPESADIICVHDGARPLAGKDLFRAVAEAVEDGADGAVPVVPVTDTIRRVSGGVVDRSGLVRVQTPQGFRAGALRAAYAAGTEATDDATLVERAGGTVVTVDGHSSNIKITMPADLVVAAALLDT